MTEDPTRPAGDLHWSLDAESRVGTVELRRPPNNFFDVFLLRELLAALARLDADPDCRAIVLTSQGKHFCAGRDFSKPRQAGDESSTIYAEAAGLLEIATPIVAVVHGAAIGAGLGLALCADFRICSPEAYFSANFVRLGTHHGFGLTATLPRLVGVQRATEILYSGRRVGGTEATEIGLADLLTTAPELCQRALDFAAGLAAQPPLALQAIRATMRAGLVDDFRRATARESAEQERLNRTEDFREAVASIRERRPGRFTGR